MTGHATLNKKRFFFYSIPTSTFVHFSLVPICKGFLYLAARPILSTQKMLTLMVPSLLHVCQCCCVQWHSSNHSHSLLSLLHVLHVFSSASLKAQASQLQTKNKRGSYTLCIMAPANAKYPHLFCSLFISINWCCWKFY